MTIRSYSPGTSWYTVGVLTLAYMLSFIDRSILSLMVGPIRSDMGITDTEFSLLHGLAFALFYTLLGVPIARLADRTNRRNLIVIGIAFWSLMTATCGLTKSFGQLFIARMGVGVGEAALSPAAYSMIADLFPRERLGRALGIYSSGVYIGIGLSFILGGVLIDALSGSEVIALPLVGELRPWQLTFMIVGAPGLLVALWILTLGEPQRGQDFIRAGVPISQVIDYLRSNLKTYGLHFMGFSMVTLLYNGIMAWSAEYFIRIHGMARGDIGPILGLIILVFGSTGVICGGLLSDRFAKMGYSDAPIRAALIGVVLLVPFAVIAPLQENPQVSLLLFCPMMFLGSFPFGPAATALQLVSPSTMRAQFSALYLFCVNLTGIGFGATVTALVTDYVFQDDMKLHYSMSLVAGFGGALAIIILLLAMKPFGKTVDAMAAAN
jgi:MFS family permease